MSKRLIIFIIAVFGFIGFGFSQDAPAVPKDTTYWTRGLESLFTFNQSSYNNWQAGGENSIAFNARIKPFIRYNKDRVSWRNRLDLSYGFTDFESQGVRKTDDLIDFITRFGYKIKKEGDSRLFWTTAIAFTSQFTDGFQYPNDSIPISKFLAPGYVVINSGLEYKRGDILSVTYSPIASKLTFVRDDSLSAAGAYGVEIGEQFRSEVGTTVNVAYVKTIAKNITYDAKLSLFTNYQKNFGNIDMNWENLFLLKVNDIISTTLVLHLIYDDDINVPIFDDDGIKTGVGPRMQFKELFGIGITLKL